MQWLLQRYECYKTPKARALRVRFPTIVEMSRDLEIFFLPLVLDRASEADWGLIISTPADQYTNKQLHEDPYNCPKNEQRYCNSGHSSTGETQLCGDVGLVILAARTVTNRRNDGGVDALGHVGTTPSHKQCWGDGVVGGYLDLEWKLRADRVLSDTFQCRIGGDVGFAIDACEAGQIGDLKSDGEVRSIPTDELWMLRATFNLTSSSPIIRFNAEWLCQQIFLHHLIPPKIVKCFNLGNTAIYSYFVKSLRYTQGDTK